MSNTTVFPSPNGLKTEALADIGYIPPIVQAEIVDLYEEINFLKNKLFTEKKINDQLIAEIEEIKSKPSQSDSTALYF